MTPTLSGRWQTRLLLLTLMGCPITMCFSLATFDPTPFFILFLVGFFGVFWDIIYNQWQKFRWDHDWPPTLQWVTGLTEGIFIYVVLWLIEAVTPVVILPPAWLFLLHYWTVWWAVFAFAHSFMRAFFPRWRFNGGQWI